MQGVLARVLHRLAEVETDREYYSILDIPKFEMAERKVLFFLKVFCSVL